MNGLWNQILVSRDAFLLESLAAYVDDEILERLQSVSPAQAGVGPRVVARMRDRLNAQDGDRAAAVALPSALASGVMRAFTLPLEYASYLYESALLVQKLLYLYTGIKEEHMLAHHQLPGYLCIFFGTAFTAKGVSAVSGTLMRMALRHALKMRMSSLVPLAGGAVNAAVTRLSMKQLAEELIRGLREIAPYVVIDCSSYIANDILSAVALMEADSVLRLANSDLHSIGALSRPLPLLRELLWDD